MDTQSAAIGYESGDAQHPPRDLPPRVWPAVFLVVAFWAAQLALANIELPLFGRFMGMLISSGLLLICFLAWWSLDRRGRRGERLAGVLAWLIAGVVVGAFTFKSLGIMPMLLTAMPWVFTAWAVWLVLGRTLALPIRTRRRGLAVVLALTWGTFTLFRMEGLSGSGDMTLAWRWRKSPEERYLALQAQRSASAGKPTATTAPVELTPADWPGFRGPQRDGVVRALSIATDWQTAPPKLLWKQPVGPGWSSMCIVGGRVYTQEQRGALEAVVCRDADTGAEIWAHLDGERFSEAMAGPGPRATPTFAVGRIYALTARGLLFCLDASSGEKAWQRDVAAESAAPLPIWGFCASPLFNRGHVIVFAGGETKGVLAYDAQTGAPAWTAPAGKVSYSSVQEATVAGEPQLLVWSDKGVVAMNPDSGAIQWELPVGSPSGMPRSLQPHPFAGGVLVASEGDSGAARVEVTRDGADWRPTKKWATPLYRPSFNDFVVKGDYLYGIDGGAMSCVDLKDGKRKWRKGRFGSGQVLLLDDQSLLLVLCESGEVALIAAKPDGLQELARIPAIEGKTWNHPAIARGRLFVRNGEEIACFELKQ
jgi:outer membrane protein assembly factor BamB